MNRYANNETSSGGLLKYGIRLHHLTLKHTIPYLLFMTIAKYVAVLLLALFPNGFVQAIIYIVVIAAIAYFFAAALLATHHAFKDKPVATKDALKLVWQRIMPILITLFVYIVGAIVTYFFVKSILLGVEKLISNQATVMHQGMLLISLLISLVYIMLFYFSFALSVIDKTPFYKAFYDSALLGEKEKMGILFLFLIFGATILLLTPGMISEYFLSMYHLDALFDFVVLCVAGPLYINLLLLLINDAKQ